MNHPYRLVGLADVMALLLDGWSVVKLQYADRCTLDGGQNGPAAFLELGFRNQRQYIFLVDDGRAMSHRAVIAQFREHPVIWKRTNAGPEDLMGSISSAPPQPAEEWGTIPQPFPEALDIAPNTLESVIPVQQVQVESGVSVALTSLERYAGGARIHYVCHIPHAGPSTETVPRDVIAVDDKHRMYELAASGLSQHGTRFTGCLVIAPHIPASVRRFTVTIGEFGTDGQSVRGPWVFPIVLE